MQMPLIDRFDHMGLHLTMPVLRPNARILQTALLLLSIASQYTLHGPIYTFWRFFAHLQTCGTVLMNQAITIRLVYIAVQLTFDRDK